MTDPEKSNALLSIEGSAGLQVVFDLMEELALKTEKTLLSQPPWSTEIVGLQAKAHAERLMVEEVLARVEYLIKEGKTPTERLVPENRTLNDRAIANAEPPILVEEMNV